MCISIEGLVRTMYHIDLLAQDLSTNRRVRQGDSKAGLSWTLGSLTVWFTI